MEYLWTDYNYDAVYQVSEFPPSPFEERQSSPLDGNPVEINILCRFSEIFLPLIKAFEKKIPHIDNTSNEESSAHIATRRMVENVYLHFLAQLDRTCGFHLFSLEEFVLQRSLERGVYGKKLAEIFTSSLTGMERQAIIHLLYQQEKSKGRILYYKEALHILFPKAIAYFYEDEQRFLIYVPEPFTKEGMQKQILLRLLFLDLTCKEEFFYFDRHFGIIGKPPTMRMDNMILYGSDVSRTDTPMT